MKKQLNLIKIGGSIVDAPALKQQFLDAFQLLRGTRCLVHGGGLIANQMCEKLGIEAKMHEGRRITDKETLDIVTMTYAGLINKNLVGCLIKRDFKAVGLSGIDGITVQARKRPAQPFDYGFAGDVVQINPELLDTLLKSDFLPVVAPLSVDLEGQILNTNADTMASSIAQGLADQFEVKLHYIMDLNGVRLDVADPSSTIENLSSELYQELIHEGKIHSGMLPKLKNCFEALKGGVGEVRICSVDGLENLAKGQVGTGTRVTL